MKKAKSYSMEERLKFGADYKKRRADGKIYPTEKKKTEKKTEKNDKG